MKYKTSAIFFWWWKLHQILFSILKVYYLYVVFLNELIQFAYLFTKYFISDAKGIQYFDMNFLKEYRSQNKRQWKSFKKKELLRYVFL